MYGYQAAELVGIKIDSKQSENDAESWEEEESLEGGDLQSP